MMETVLLWIRADDVTTESLTICPGVMGWPQLRAKNSHSFLSHLPHSGMGQKTGGTGVRNLMVQNKDRELARQLLLWAEWSELRESSLILNV